ncbi:MAG: MarR family winged helix-turn-helix transcriptional regulator [Gammaproteobacteria bacterium]|nr:MarR family winged helix-turn-helix transcriptional regulator [Gammaproteobacteria bacterium]MDH5694846.1 MarR family winged helix-turn-helix transcriptional regulator [Gammaproteobacteria bacterium]
MGSFKSNSPKESAGLQFWKLHQYWQKRIIEVLFPISITHTQFVILATLRWYQDQDIRPTQQQVANISGIEKMTLSKSIRQLEAKKLLVREKSKLDSRSVSLFLSDTGLKILVTAIKSVEEIDAEIFGVLGKEKSAKFSNHLFKINQALGI